MVDRPPNPPLTLEELRELEDFLAGCTGLGKALRAVRELIEIREKTPKMPEISTLRISVKQD